MGLNGNTKLLIPDRIYIHIQMPLYTNAIITLYIIYHIIVFLSFLFFFFFKFIYRFFTVYSLITTFNYHHAEVCPPCTSLQGLREAHQGPLLRWFCGCGQLEGGSEGQAPQ